MELIKLVKGNEKFGLPQQVAMCYVGSRVYTESGAKTGYILRGVDSEGLFILEEPNSYGHNLCSLGEVCLSLYDCKFSAFKAYEYGLELTGVSYPYSRSDLTKSKLDHWGPGVTKVVGVGKALVLTIGMKRDSFIHKNMGIKDYRLATVPSVFSEGRLHISALVEGCDCIIFDELVGEEFEDYDDHLRYMRPLEHGVPVLMYARDDEEYAEILNDLTRTARRYGITATHEEIEGVGYYRRFEICDKKLFTKHVVKGKPL